MANLASAAKLNGVPPTQTNGHAPAKFSLSLGSKKPRHSAAPPNKAKRPHSMLEEVDDDHVPEATLEISQISSFGKSLDDAPPITQAPYTIPAIPNRNWREESHRKRQKSGLPGTETRDPIIPAASDLVESSTKYGLTVMEHVGTAVLRKLDSAAPPAAAMSMTVEDQAMDALTGRRAPAVTVIAPQSPSVTEEEALRASYTSAPPMATLEEYAATPVAGFGAAILRGYLKAGETLEMRLGGREKEKESKRRPGLLGIGAKESGEGVELGAWGKGSGGKKGKSWGRTEVSYNPLALRNKKTGEVVSEEVLRERLEVQDRREREVGEAKRVVESGEREERGHKRDGDGRRKEDQHRDRVRSPRRSEAKMKLAKKMKFSEEEYEAGQRRIEQYAGARRRFSEHEIWREEIQRREAEGDDGHWDDDVHEEYGRYQSSRRDGTWI